MISNRLFASPDFEAALWLFMAVGCQFRKVGAGDTAANDPEERFDCCDVGARCSA